MKRYIINLVLMSPKKGEDIVITTDEAWGWSKEDALQAVLIELEVRMGIRNVQWKRYIKKQEIDVYPEY